MANLIIQENGVARTRPAVNGEEITVKTPCSCSDVTGVQINGVAFPFYDALGNSLAGVTGLFAKNSLIRVLIDTDNTRAYILNRGITAADVGAVPAPHTWRVGVSTPGWYRLGELAGSAQLVFSGVYAQDKPTLCTVDVQTGFMSSISRVSGDHKDLFNQVSKVRVVHMSGAWYLDVYYASSKGNIVEISGYVTKGSFTKHDFTDVTESTARVDAELDLNEWENPPMSLNTEYRTTERINGKAVYKRIYNSRLGGGIEYRLEGETDYKPYAVAVGAYAKSFSYMPENTSLLSWAENLNASGSFIVGPSNTDTPNTDSSYWICQLYHQGTDRILLECTDITGGNLNSTFYNMRIDNNWCGWKRRATIFKTTATIPATGWTANGAGVKQTVSVPGISWKDDPVVGDVITDNQVTNITIKEAWNCVSYIVCENNAITLFCDGGTPAVDIPIQIQCVR